MEVLSDVVGVPAAPCTRTPFDFVDVDPDHVLGPSLDVEPARTALRLALHPSTPVEVLASLGDVDAAAHLTFLRRSDPYLDRHGERDLVLAALRLPLSSEALDLLSWRECVGRVVVLTALLAHPACTPRQMVTAVFRHVPVPPHAALGSVVVSSAPPPAVAAARLRVWPLHSDPALSTALSSHELFTHLALGLFPLGDPGWELFDVLARDLLASGHRPDRALLLSLDGARGVLA